MYFYQMVHITSELLDASSLHPKILTTVDLSSPTVEQENKGDCQLDVVYVLPASVFVDPYQLQDLEKVIGKATIFGEHDLELPLEKVKEPRGSIVFLRQPKNISNSFQLTLPIHLRYQQPSLKRDNQSITIEAPYAGWTCGSYDWPPLSYPVLLPLTIRADQDVFTRLSNNPTPLTLSVPIGKVQQASIVTLGTFIAVVFGTIWITRSVFISIKKRRRAEAKGKRRKSE